MFFGIVVHKAGLCDAVRARRGRFHGLRMDVWSGPVGCPGERCQQLLSFTAHRSSFIGCNIWVGAALCMTVFTLVEIGIDFSYRGVS